MNDLTLTEADQGKVRQIADAIVLEDSQAILQFGVGAQGKVSGFADTMLEQVRSKDSGHVGEVLTDLVLKIKEVDAGSLGTSGTSWFDKLFSGIRRFLARYEKLETQIEKIVGQLTDSRMTLLRDITLLDQLYQKNGDYLKELDLYIAAGRWKLEQLKTVDLPAKQAEASASADPVVAQRLHDFQQALVRFEKKLHDLSLSRIIAIQTAPQIRLIQNNDQALVEKIQSSILTTIPLWKSQIVIAITLLRQKKALGVQKAVTDATNELLTKNSELLKQGSIEVAQESERAVVEIETLKKVNADLIATIEETLRIQSEGAAKRAQAEQDIKQIEADLKAKLAAVRS